MAEHPATTAPLFTLATARPHAFGPSWIVAPEVSPTGHEQHERACTACPLVKITVIDVKDPRLARAYRWGGDGPQFYQSRDPVCVPVVAATAK